MHLRALNARGLITPRRKKNFVIYTFEPNENLEVAPNLLAALKEVFKAGSTNREIYHLCTSFTHQRRIEIVRILYPAPMDYDLLSVKTNYSQPALYRHLSKLLARGIIQKQNHLYSVAKSDNPLHNALIYAAVC
jgi:DNA-binding transcriptional ArsR family regulator